MNKKQLSGVMLMGIMMFALPALMATSAKAVDESVTVVNYFNIAIVDELSVTLLGDSAVLSAGGGQATTNNIDYNFTTLTQTWLNATRTGGGDEQDFSNPILSLDNTGTTNLTIKMNFTATLVGSCFAVRYNATNCIDTGVIGPGNTTDLDTTAVTINESFLPEDPALSIWLYANATSCTSTGSATSRTLTIWAIRDP